MLSALSVFKMFVWLMETQLLEESLDMTWNYFVIVSYSAIFCEQMANGQKEWSSESGKSVYETRGLNWLEGPT